MSRIKSSEGYVQVKLRLPESLAAEVKAILLDPLRGRSRYGTLSKVGTELFRAWVRKQRGEYSDRHD